MLFVIVLHKSSLYFYLNVDFSKGYLFFLICVSEYFLKYRGGTYT